MIEWVSEKKRNERKIIKVEEETIIFFKMLTSCHSQCYPALLTSIYMYAYNNFDVLIIIR